MKGLKENGPCAGSQVELKGDMLFTINSLSEVTLQKVFKKGILGTVIYNLDNCLVVEFEGGYLFSFETVKAVRLHLGEE